MVGRARPLLYCRCVWPELSEGTPVDPELVAVARTCLASGGTVDEGARAVLGRTKSPIMTIKALRVAEPSLSLRDARALVDRNLPPSVLRATEQLRTADAWPGGRTGERAPMPGAASPGRAGGRGRIRPGRSAARTVGAAPASDNQHQQVTGLPAPRARPDQATRAAASGSPGAALRPPGAGPVSRRSSTPRNGPAAPARTAPRQRTGSSGESARRPIIAGPSG